jgi:hypothetical protein
MFAENLEGKWLVVNKSNVYSDPSVYIIEFLNNKISYYNFDELLFEENYETKGTGIFVKNVKKYNLKILDFNLINIDFYSEDGLMLFFTSKLIKLNTHIIKESNAIDIVNQKFRINDDNFSNLIVFNKLLVYPEIFNLGDHQVGNYIKLEKFINLYFVVIYFEEYRQKAIPIREYDGSNLILYGLDYLNPNLEFIAEKISL